MKLGVPPRNNSTKKAGANAQPTRPRNQQPTRKGTKVMPGQSYVWRVVVRNILPSPKLNRTFTNKVDALNYLNKVISQGYRHSKIEKWEGN